MFRKILIANRGEIALRVIRACKELGVSTVAVHSDVDRESLHVKLADESVCIGPADARESYLATPKIMSAAEITDADAIHPGYGFLAENAEFANVCEKCGITFIGPSARDISVMGDKLSARKAMSDAGLPVFESIGINLKDQVETLRIIENAGLPLIVKAAAGGGGKGIKVIRTIETAWNLLKTAQSEAQAAFGDSRIYLERYLEDARHIEFQVAADREGRVIHFGERDCSIQRRFQKVLEEAPSPVVTQEVRNRIGTVVTRAIQDIGYRNVGTVEFLMDRNQRFYFLEMNTRIQVEHPVTEQITNVDLVKLQIRLASGDSLPWTQDQIRFQGHAMEMRINAEDPERFFPSAGEITSYHTPGGVGVRVDSAAYDGYTVSPHYDSLIAKLVVHGADRAEAISRANAALDEFLIEGIHSNIPLHKRILADPEFRKGNTSVRYLDNLLK